MVPLSASRHGVGQEAVRQCGFNRREGRGVEGGPAAAVHAAADGGRWGVGWERNRRRLGIQPPAVAFAAYFTWGRPSLSSVHRLLSAPPPPLSTLPIFFSTKRGPAAVSFLPENNFLQVLLLFSAWHFFSGWGVRGSSPGVGGVR